MKKKKLDPYDDEQNEFGVSYKEYIKWKNKEEIEARKLPHNYQFTGGKETVRKVKQGMQNKVDKASGAVTKTYQANMNGIKQTGNKWKEKAIGYHMKLSKNKNDKEETEQPDSAVFNYHFRNTSICPPVFL